MRLAGYLPRLEDFPLKPRVFLAAAATNANTCHAIGKASCNRARTAAIYVILAFFALRGFCYWRSYYGPHIAQRRRAQVSVAWGISISM
jgi:hypothetical protein